MSKNLTYIYLLCSILSMGCGKRDHLYSLSISSSYSSNSANTSDREKNKAERRAKAHTQVDRTSSAISFGKSVSRKLIFDEYEPNLASFDQLSVEEKTESLLASTGEDCTSICYPTFPLEAIQEKQEIDRRFASMEPYGYCFSSPQQEDTFSLVLSESKNLNFFKAYVKDLSLACFEDYKFGMDILVRYDNGDNRLLS